LFDEYTENGDRIFSFRTVSKIKLISFLKIFLSMLLKLFTFKFF